MSRLPLVVGAMMILLLTLMSCTKIDEEKPSFDTFVCTKNGEVTYSVDATAKFRNISYSEENSSWKFSKRGMLADGSYKQNVGEFCQVNPS